MTNDRKLASKIIDTVGGKENISNVTHCMTRLRFVLKDEGLASDDALNAIPEIISVVRAGGQVQLVIGPTVDKVYDAVCKEGGFETQATIDENLDVPKLPLKERFAPKRIVNLILDAVSGSIAPILPIFCIAGIFRMFTILLGPEGAGLLSEESNMYQLFTLVGDAAYYFLPVFGAYAAAKKFKTSPVLALMTAVIMIHPSMLAIVEEGAPFDVYGIPMTLVNYTQSVLPIILIVWVQSYVEGLIKKFCPDMLRILVIPVGTMLIMLPLALCVFGPAVSFVMGIIANIIIWLGANAGPLCGLVVGATWNLVIATGMHVPILTAMMPGWLEVGYDAVCTPGTTVVVYVTFAVALAYGIRAKGKANRQLGWTTLATYALGRVSEPIIYGILLRDKKALAWSMIGGAAGGLVCGLLNARIFIFSGVGFPWMNVIKFSQDIVPGAIGCFIGFAVTFALCMVFGFDNREATEKDAEDAMEA